MKILMMLALFASGIRGPVIGYVHDRTMQAVRPINGIPGSSSLGEPVELPFAVAEAAFTPEGKSALVISAADDGATYAVKNLDETPDIQRIEGSIRGDRLFLNADGSTGAVLASESRQLQLVRGMIAESPLDLSSISGTITAVAIDRAGSKVLIAATADHGALYLVDSTLESRPRLIADFGSPAALALLNDDNDVVVADAATNDIVVLRSFSTSPQVFRFAGERDGISEPVGLRISTDGVRLLVANRRSRTLDTWDLPSQSLARSLPLDAEPTKIGALRGSSIFALNEVGDHPLLVLDENAENADSPVSFVPADRSRQ